MELLWLLTLNQYLANTPLTLDQYWPSIARYWSTCFVLKLYWKPGFNFVLMISKNINTFLDWNKTELLTIWVTYNPNYNKLTSCQEICMWSSFLMVYYIIMVRYLMVHYWWFIILLHVLRSYDIKPKKTLTFSGKPIEMCDQLDSTRKFGVVCPESTTVSQRKLLVHLQIPADY